MIVIDVLRSEEKSARVYVPRKCALNFFFFRIIIAPSPITTVEYRFGRGEKKIMEDVCFSRAMRCGRIQ